MKKTVETQSMATGKINFLGAGAKLYNQNYERMERTFADVI